MSENSPKTSSTTATTSTFSGGTSPTKSVDLVYLDPPFNSNANYNVLFAERDGTQAAAQIKVFGAARRAAGRGRPWNDTASRTE